MVARGEHLAAIQSQGLILNTEKEGRLICQPTRATDELESLDEQDAILLCVKEFDLSNCVTRLQSAIGSNTIILLLLNGVDVYDRIRITESRGRVQPACVYVGTHIESPGVVTQKGGACKILLGPDPTHPNQVPEDLLENMKEARILFEWSPNVTAAIWEKFIFICSFGLVTAAFDKVIGEIAEDSVLRRFVEDIMTEILKVADGRKIKLPGDITQRALEKATTFPYETKTSFQRDFEKADKKDERDLFAGAMLKYAAALEIELPRISEIAEKLEKIKPQA